MSAPCVMMDAMDTQSPTYSDDELTASLAEHLASLDRDDSYRVERVLKCSDVETTELVGSVEKVGVEPHPKRVGPAS